jgi:hypothetical protein
MSSTINKRLKFLTEIEFEEGGREINIEFAALGVMLNSAFNLRGGIIMHPMVHLIKIMMGQSGSSYKGQQLQRILLGQLCQVQEWGLMVSFLKIVGFLGMRLI